MEECIPKATLPPRRNRPWLTKKLIQAIRRRNFLYKRAKATGNYSKYRSYRNKVVGYLRQVKKAYFQKLNPKSPKQFWKVCKLLNSTNSTIPTLVQGDATAQTNVQKAEMLNSYFATCFNESQPPLESIDFHLATPPDTFPSELLCSEDEISVLLSSLDVSKSNGPDGISARMLNVFQPVTKSRQSTKLLEKIQCRSYSQDSTSKVSRQLPTNLPVKYPQQSSGKTCFPTDYQRDG